MPILFATPILLLMATPPLVAQAPADPGLLKYAPPVREIDGLTAAPIDISSLHARVHFDVEAKQATAVAKLEFSMLADGMPLFDLKQNITKARLDGKEIAVDQLAAHDFGGSCGTMRIAARTFKSGSRHQLEFQYSLAKPLIPSGPAMVWGDGTMEWDLFASDLTAGRYLEQWFPANLIYDQFAFQLEIEISGASEDHHLVTNAGVEEQGKHHWLLTFPPTMTAFSPMVVILPASAAERSSSQVKIGDRTITIDVCKRNQVRTPLQKVHQQAAKALKDFTALSGPWPHGDRCTIFVWTGGRSMEYDGATTTSMGALRHELFHSWYGRGVKPASQNDGWFDEAWDVFACDGARFDPKLLKAKGSPVTLSSADPWNRVTPRGSYSQGAMFFARLANLLGEDELKAMMSEFSQLRAHRVTSTADMASWLAEQSGDKGKQVIALFDRYVFGHDQ